MVRGVNTRWAWGGAAVVAAALGLAGCEAPRGDTGGRIDPSRTTAADERSPQANMPSLYEFGDRVAERLAADISSIPEIRDAPTRVVIELGGLNNKTRTSTQDFEQIQVRLRNRFANSDYIRNKAMVVDSTARMDQELDRIQGDTGGRDLLQENIDRRGAGRTDRYDPRQIFVLLGDFYESARGGTRRYYFEFRLTNLKTRSIVFSESYDLGQVMR
ncbi:MAG: hypothetical protein IBJ11_12095 [Phycisphaerales bacterium]|nr:hypothetical protein [Phycisphaerales bacterium]